MTDAFVFAGEKSGDLLGARWIKENPGLKIAAVAGPEMRAEKIDCIFKTERFETMGFLDLIPALPRLIYLFHKVKRAILKTNPKTVILIDYAEFNIRLAKSLRKAGFEGTIVQYVCPSVWAWRKGRIQTMERYLDEVWCLLPFEPKYFSNIKAIYVGHPLLKEKQPYDSTWRRKLDKNKWILGIFPGSRTKEIKRNLPLQLEAAKQLYKDHNLQPVISCVHAKHLRLILKLNKENFPIVDVRHTYNLMHDASYALATSGTITLQLALMGVPTIVNFAISRLDQWIAQKILRINLDHYALPNIIANKTLFKELYGSNLTTKTLTSALKKLITDTKHYENIQSACATLKALLENE